MAHFYGSAPSLVYSDGDYLPGGGDPTIGEIISGDTTLTIPYTGAVTHYRVYEIGSAAPAWISAPPSPIVFTGVSNREYNVEVSGNGSTVADSAQAGTNNPGTGGAPFPSYGSTTLDVGFRVSSAGFNFLNTGYAVQSAGSTLLSTSFAIQGTGNQSLNTGYAVRSAGAFSVPVGYAVRGAGFNSLDTGFEVISTFSAGSATLSVGYAVTGSGQNTLSAGFAVAASGSATLDVGYGVSVQGLTGSATLAVGYAVRTGQSATLGAGYAVTARQFNALSVGFEIEGSGVPTNDLVMTLTPVIAISTRVEQGVTRLSMVLRPVVQLS